jgi:2-amino-4-hydroxy-6-hydroxymethyldihydropteridine diphosphokinase
MSRVFLGLGSNEGDRLACISSALQLMAAIPRVRLRQLATITETEPLGPPQPPFLNTVVEVETTCHPVELLKLLKDIERRLGRLPAGERWGPRPIDLDLLLYDDRVIETPDLAIPHPRLHERRFVLEPLAQLAPDVVHPVLQRTIRALLAELDAPRHAAIV